MGEHVWRPICFMTDTPTVKCCLEQDIFRQKINLSKKQEWTNKENKSTCPFIYQHKNPLERREI